VTYTISKFPEVKKAFLKGDDPLAKAFGFCDKNLSFLKKIPQIEFKL